MTTSSVSEPTLVVDDLPYVIVLKSGSHQSATTTQRHYTLEGKDVIIGADPACDLVVYGTDVAPQQALLYLRGGEWHLKDLVDRLNMYVNDSLIGRWTFRKDGDIIRLGDHVRLKFFLGNTADSHQAKESHRLSITDGLTGVYLRRYFDDKLAEDMEWCLQRAQPLSLLMLDIDHFKRFNDSYGHAIGDRVLKEVTDRIQPLLRKDKDTLARYGGEEFGLILPGVPLDAAYKVADRVRYSIAAEPLIHEGKEYALTISVGVATTNKPTSVLKLVEAADGKLYTAKNNGRNRVEK